jgi:hypothetical protein
MTEPLPVYIMNDNRIIDLASINHESLHVNGTNTHYRLSSLTFPPKYPSTEELQIRTADDLDTQQINLHNKR